MKMKASTTQHSEEGFAAVTVMVISLLGGLIVFDTVQENVNQERMAGNYYKELNARLQAENGLAAAYNALSANSSISNTEMMTALNTNTSTSYRYTLDAWENSADTSIMELDSKGAHYEGNYDIRGTITAGSSPGNNVFNNAITTCDGASLGSGGVIDSYNSDDGAYNSSNPGGNGDITILNENSSLNLSGSADIYGDVSVNGNISLTNGKIYGDASATGNIITNNSGEASIGGNIEAGGNVTYKSTDGTNAPDSISSDESVTIGGEGQTSFNGDVSYGGDNGGTYTSGDNVENNVTQYDEDHVSEIASQECDILNIADEFDNTTDGLGTLANSASTSMAFGYPKNKYKISDAGLTAYDDTWNVKDWVNVDANQEIVDFQGTDTSVYVIDMSGFGDASKSLTVESGSNVTIYLSTETFIGGSIEVEEGAILTILTESSFEVGSDGSITNLNDDGTTSSSVVNSNGNIGTTLYSNYKSINNSDYGVNLFGNSDSYMATYATDASVKIQASGDQYGSIRSNYVDVTNTSIGLHYDEQMANANIGDSTGDGTVEITRWF